MVGKIDKRDESLSFLADSIVPFDPETAEPICLGNGTTFTFNSTYMAVAWSNIPYKIIDIN